MVEMEVSGVKGDEEWGSRGYRLWVLGRVYLERGGGV